MEETRGFFGIKPLHVTVVLHFFNKPSVRWYAWCYCVVVQYCTVDDPLPSIVVAVLCISVDCLLIWIVMGVQ